MTQETPTPTVAAPAPAPDKKKVRRVETIGLIAFVSFVVVVHAFGRAPVAYENGPLGLLALWNWPSLIGIIAAFLSAVLLLPRLRTIWTLPAITRALTLIALLGLVLHAAVALPRAGTPASAVQMTTDPEGFERLLPKGGESWVVAGKTYRIASSCFLKLPQGLQYNIYVQHELPTSDSPPMEDILAIARPFILYAYNQGEYQRGSAAQAGGEPLVPTGITVSLFEWHRGKMRMFRAGMDMEQIRWRAAAEAPAVTPSAASAPAGQS
jgi:hypothetical protein